MSTTRTVLALSLFACGDDAPAKVDAQPIDAQVRVIDIEVGSGDNGSELWAVREPGGAWRSIPLTDRTFTVYSDSFEFASVCPADGGYAIDVEAKTVATTYVFAFCSPSGSPPPTFPITGTMMQAGQVAIGGRLDTSTTGPWNFEIDAPQGPSSLVAFGADRWLRRPITVTAAASTEPVDTVTDGTASELTVFTLNGTAPPETVTTTTQWFDANGFVLVTKTGRIASRPPAGLRQPNDITVVSADAHDGMFSRGATLFDFFGPIPEVATFTLLPKLDSVTFAGATASWTTLPTGFTRFAFMSGTHTYSIATDASLIDTATSLALELPTDLPAWKPEWNPTAPTGYYFSVSATDALTNGDLSTTISTPIAMPRRALRDLERLRLEQRRPIR